jgi:hypothetical protein
MADDLSRKFDDVQGSGPTAGPFSPRVTTASSTLACHATPTVRHAARALGVTAIVIAHQPLLRARVTGPRRVHRAIGTSSVDSPSRARPHRRDAVAHRLSVRARDVRAAHASGGWLAAGARARVGLRSARAGRRTTAAASTSSRPSRTGRAGPGGTRRRRTTRAVVSPATGRDQRGTKKHRPDDHVGSGSHRHPPLPRSCARNDKTSGPIPPHRS